MDVKGFQRLMSKPPTMQTPSFQPVLAELTETWTSSTEASPEASPLSSSLLLAAQTPGSLLVLALTCCPAAAASLSLWTREVAQTAMKAMPTPRKSSVSLPLSPPCRSRVSKVPRTRAVPMQSGKANAKPTICMPLVSIMLARLKIDPAATARSILLQWTCKSSGTKRALSAQSTGAAKPKSSTWQPLPTTPSVRAATSAVAKTPTVKST
mmetsp:Transcript_14396/g.25832  ORF Transcript_14396/g.25832 Transcript_14396/m.25832 type:complete len:210 (+) Transcript_14396:503-1132(+)